jgi:hypothetical protein
VNLVKNDHPACAEPVARSKVASVWSLHCYPVLLRNHPSLISSETFNAFSASPSIKPEEQLGVVRSQMALAKMFTFREGAQPSPSHWLGRAECRKKRLREFWQ